MLDEVGLIQLALVLILQALHVDPAALIGLPSISLENITANLPFSHLPLLPGHASITTVKELPATDKSEAVCIKKAPRLFSRDRNTYRGQQDHFDQAHPNHPLYNSHLSANPANLKVSGRTLRNRRRRNRRRQAARAARAASNYSSGVVLTAAQQRRRERFATQSDPESDPEAAPSDPPSHNPRDRADPDTDEDLPEVADCDDLT